jgi:urease accessory protein
MRSTAMATDPLATLRLLTWLSPSFPVGAFSYSHGLEYAVHDGVVTKRDHLAQWISDLIGEGSLRNDVILLAEAWHAASAADLARLRHVAELGEAMALSSERLLETMDQGRSFMAAAAAWVARPEWDFAMPYPVAIGAIAGTMKVTVEDICLGFLHAAAANLVAAGIRLIPLGQSEGTSIMASLECLFITVARVAADSSLTDLGSATFVADMASMHHETLGVRLFRS